MSKACLLGCKRRKRGSKESFFQFPEKDVERFLKWAEAVNKPPEFFNRSRRYLCSLHFDEQDFDQSCVMKRKLMPQFNTRLVLKKSAVPSKYLTVDEVCEFLKSRELQKENLSVADESDQVTLSGGNNSKDEDEDEIQPEPFEFHDTRDVEEENEESENWNLARGRPCEIEMQCPLNANKEEAQLSNSITNEIIEDEDLKTSEIDADPLALSVDNNEGDGPCRKDAHSSKWSCCNQCQSSFNWEEEPCKHKLTTHGYFLGHICKRGMTSTVQLQNRKKQKHSIMIVHQDEFGPRFPDDRGLRECKWIHVAGERFGLGPGKSSLLIGCRACGNSQGNRSLPTGKAAYGSCGARVVTILPSGRST